MSSRQTGCTYNFKERERETERQREREGKDMILGKVTREIWPWMEQVGKGSMDPRSVS